MTVLTVFIDGVGLLGPGIADWAQGQEQLAGRVPGQWLKTVLTAPAHLPPAERRRAGPIIRVSHAAGLVEAVTQAVVQAEPVLLVAFDTDYPEPLRTARPVPDTFGLALVLSPVRTARSLGQVTLHPASYLSTGAADVLSDAVLEAQRQSIPAARGLPLLAALARQQAGVLRLDYLDDCRLELEFTPC
jgi:hypothetical protein